MQGEFPPWTNRDDLIKDTDLNDWVMLIAAPEIVREEKDNIVTDAGEEEELRLFLPEQLERLEAAKQSFVQLGKADSAILKLYAKYQQSFRHLKTLVMGKSTIGDNSSHLEKK